MVSVTGWRPSEHQISSWPDASGAKVHLVGVFLHKTLSFAAPALAFLPKAAC
jgi:hypothetical protein